MIIFLYGADTFRSRRFLHELKDKFTRDVDPDASSVNLVDGTATTVKDLAEKINTGSLFVKKRLVIVENIFKNKQEKIFNELTDYLKKLTASSDNVLIFRDEELNTKNKPVKLAAKKLFTLLSGQPYSQEFPALNNSQLLTFIKKESQLYGKDLATPAALVLINLTGGDLWLIAGAVRKLAFSADEKTISVALVKELINGAYDENIFGLTDALSARNKKLAATLLAEQYAAGLSDEYLLTMLIRQFKILRQIRSALDNKLSPTETASQLKLHPFIIKKGLIQARNFSAANLKNYLDRLIELDYLNKTGRGQVKTKLTLLISEL
jgi:DNA polymerase-3 subunit delta